jgi:hypothetical protein
VQIPPVADVGAFWSAVLYVGPQAMLPFASALAAAAGVVLMFWQRIRVLLGRIRGAAPAAPRPPRDAQMSAGTDPR